jgi:hypothetical protein
VTTAGGLAPLSHRQASLDVEIELLDYSVEADTETGGRIDKLRLRITNAIGEPLDPLVSTWDQRRQTRSYWRIHRGAVPLEDGDSDEYHVVAPTSTARLHVDVPAQITVSRRGKQRWNSIQRTL